MKSFLHWSHKSNSLATVGGLFLLFLVPIASVLASTDDEISITVTLHSDDGSLLGKGNVHIITPNGDMEIKPNTVNNGNSEFLLPPHPGNYKIVAYAEGYYRTEQTLLLESGDDEVVELALERYQDASKIHVAVFSSFNGDKLPLPRANVGLLWQGTDASGSARIVEIRGRTDLSGLLDAGIPGEGEVVAWATHDFYQAASDGFVVDEADESLVFNLTKREGYNWISGVVLDGDSSSRLEGATVTLYLPIGLGTTPRWVETGSVMITNSNGLFWFATPASDSLVRVFKEGYFEEPIYFTKGNASKATTHLLQYPQQYREVAGRVLSSDSQQPMDGIKVGIISWFGTHVISNSTVTDEFGHYSLEIPEGGESKIVYQCFRPCVGGEPRAKVLRLDHHAVGEDLGDVIMHPMPLSADTRTITIYKLDGMPLPGAKIWFYDQQSESVIANFTAGPTGEVQIPSHTHGQLTIIVQGPNSTLSLSGPLGFTEYMPQAIPIGPGEISVRDFTLQPSEFLKGLVNMTISSSELVVAMHYTSPTSEAFLQTVILDQVFGNGNGDVEMLEVERMLKWSPQFVPMSFDNIEVYVDERPVFLSKDSIDMEARMVNGTLTFLQSGRVNWNLGMAKTLEFEFLAPSFSNINLTVHHDAGLTVHWAAPSGRIEIKSGTAIPLSDFTEHQAKINQVLVVNAEHISVGEHQSPHLSILSVVIVTLSGILRRAITPRATIKPGTKTNLLPGRLGRKQT